MKILFLATLIKNKSGNMYGGAEKSIINLANWLAESNHDVMLASVEGDAQPYFISDKVQYRTNIILSQNKLGIHLEIARNTVKVIKEFNPDMVISFWIHPLFYALPILIKKHIPFYYSERNDPKRLYSSLSRIMRHVLLKYAKGIVFQTKQAKMYFNEDIQAKSMVIHNPTYIGYNDYPFNLEEDNRIVAVGRLCEQKNYFLLIDGFEKINKLYPELVLEIYGEGALRDELMSYIKCKELEKKITLMGTYPNVVEKIYGARLFAMTSDYEGMPNALIEAMCLGITCISSDCPCGGPAELIIDEVNGYLFETNNREDFVEKLQSALSRDNCELRKSAKNICNSHKQDVIFSQWEDFLKIN